MFAQLAIFELLATFFMEYGFLVSSNDCSDESDNSGVFSKILSIEKFNGGFFRMFLIEKFDRNSS